MNSLAVIPGWALKLAGAEPASPQAEVLFGFEGMNPGWALLIACIAVFLIARSYLKQAGELSLGKRVLLTCLRSLAVILLLLMLTQPVLQVSENKPTRGALLVLMDASSSMDLQDTRNLAIDQQRAETAYGSATVPESPSRRQLVEAVARNESLNLWPRIAQSVDILVAPFGRKAGKVDSIPQNNGVVDLNEASTFFEALPKGENATAISDSLEEILSTTSGQPLTNILLITDGANNAGTPLPAVMETLKQRGLPLYVYATGVTAQQDLSIVSFTGPVLAYARESAQVNLRIRPTGYTGKSTEVLLKKGEEAIDRKKITFKDDSEIELSFDYIPESDGDDTIYAEVKALGGEATLENNKAELQLRVLDRRVKVLIIEQEPRWDFRYLLDTLKRDRRVEVNAVMLDGDSTLGQNEESRFLAALPSPQELLEYVIVVLGDVDPKRLSLEHQRALETLSRQTGGGLVFHAGPKYDPMAYRGTLLEALLPVTLISVSDQTRRYEEPSTLLLTREGRRSPLLRLDENAAQSESIWRSFPGVYWTAQTGPAKPAAEVLLVDPNKTNPTTQQPQPVLVRMPVGRGQVFYFGFDETWRWRSRVGEKYYLKIWGQVFLKLGLERLSNASDLVQLNTVRNSYNLGETVTISGRIFKPDFEPLDEAEAVGKLTIMPLAETGAKEVVREIRLGSRPGHPGDYELELLAATPGKYSVQLDHDPEAKVEFVVTASNLELRDPSLNLAGLEAIVEQPDDLFREEQLASLPERIQETLPNLQRLERYDLALNPIIFFLLILLPSAEWMLRRIYKLK